MIRNKSGDKGNWLSVFLINTMGNHPVYEINENTESLISLPYKNYHHFMSYRQQKISIG